MVVEDEPAPRRPEVDHQHLARGQLGPGRGRVLALRPVNVLVQEHPQPVPAGGHRLRVFLDEDIHRPQGEYTAAARAELAPGEVLVIDFRPARGGFVFYHHGKAFDGCNGTDCDRG